MSFELFHFTEEIAPAWDDFVTNHSQGSIHQLSCWKGFQETIPGRGNVHGYGVKNKGEIIATCWCVRMSTGFASTYWYYSARGPVVDPARTDVVQFLLQSIEQELMKTKALFWRLDPYFTPEEMKLNEQGLPLVQATQNYQPTNTLEIDLTKNDDTILAEMKRKGRYNINQARKNGVTIRVIPGKEATDKEVEAFWKLNMQTTERDNFSGHGRKYYKSFLQHLTPHAVLFLAELNGKHLAAAINTHVGEKAIYYFGASTSDPEDRKLMAPYLLQWEMMLYAKEQGCTSYDFLGIAPENEPKHAYAGISEFKWKFGGERKIYADGKEMIFRPWAYKCYRFAKKLKG